MSNSDAVTRNMMM